MLFGSLVGFGIGFAGGYAKGHPAARGDPSSDYLTPEENGFLVGGIGAGVGALVGLAVGKARKPRGQPAPQAVAVTARPLPVSAPRWEIFAGYSYLPAIRTGRFFFSPYSDPGHGVAAGLNLNVGRPFGPQSQFGFGVDLDRQSWTDHGFDSPNLFSRSDETVSVLYVSVGPRFVVRTSRVAAFWLASVDTLRGHYSGHLAFNPSSGPFAMPARSSTAWGPGLGGGVDVVRGKHVAVRIVQLNYNLFSMGGERPGQRLRVKTGVVFK